MAGSLASSTVPVFREGQEVVAFFNANRHPDGRRYVKVADRLTRSPVHGMSCGWVKAVVLERFGPDTAVSQKEPLVSVRFHGTFHDPHPEGGCVEELDMNVSPSLVKTNKFDVPPLLLSVACVRWYDYWSQREWSDENVTSDKMLVDLFDGPGSMGEVMPGEYEVYTFFVRSSEDLTRIRGDLVRGMLKAPNISAWYFLRPTKHSVHDGGYVSDYEFFEMCQLVERAGVPTGWPQATHLHRVLSGKFWTPQMSLNADFRVPATSRVHYQEFAEFGDEASKSALEALLDIRQSVRSGTRPPVEEVKGVVKLGFSWDGEDVLPFHGVQSLTRVLERVFEQPNSTQIVCILQEFVPQVICELRVLVVHDACGGLWEFHQEYLWVRMGRPGAVAARHGTDCDVSDFALASGMVVLDGEALQEFFRGDRRAMKHVEDEAARLVEHWLMWFGTECADPQPISRMDFLVSWPPDQEAPSLWTSEICECGVSLCSVGVGLRTTAVLNGVMRNHEGPGWPRPLPPVTRARQPVSSE